ncbi:MAG: hypothetical protein JWP62_2102 [Blastococcus sp.]|nr:hypothetical protein [Blastococcus sp.]
MPLVLRRGGQDVLVAPQVGRGLGVDRRHRALGAGLHQRRGKGRGGTLGAVHADDDPGPCLRLRPVAGRRDDDDRALGRTRTVQGDGAHHGAAYDAAASGTDNQEIGLLGQPHQLGGRRSRLDVQAHRDIADLEVALPNPVDGGPGPRPGVIADGVQCPHVHHVALGPVPDGGVGGHHSDLGAPDGSPSHRPTEGGQRPVRAVHAHHDPGCRPGLGEVRGRSRLCVHGVSSVGHQAAGPVAGSSLASIAPGRSSPTTRTPPPMVPSHDATIPADAGPHGREPAPARTRDVVPAEPSEVIVVPAAPLRTAAASVRAPIEDG